MHNESETSDKKKPCFDERKPYKDPVQEHSRKEKLKNISLKSKTTSPKPPIDDDECKSLRIKPSMGTRLDLQGPAQQSAGLTLPSVETSVDKKIKLIQEAERKGKLKYVCKRTKIKLPMESAKKELKIELAVPSAELQEAKVKPKLVTPDPSFLYPYGPNKDSLDLKKPKSGIFINETLVQDYDMGDYDSFDLVYRRKGRPKKYQERSRRHSKKHKHSSSREGEGRKRRKKKRSKKKKAGLPTIQEGDETEAVDENYLSKQFRRKVTQISQATSFQSNDIKSSSSSEEVEVNDLLTKYQQKFQRESDLKRYEIQRRQIKRGTLESHSYTNIEAQPILKNFYFGCKTGTIQQNDESFGENRNHQGICIPIAAYCYAILKHPNKWTTEDIDEILRYGNNLYVECLSSSRKSKDPKEFQPSEVGKFCFMGDKVCEFKIDDAEVTGYIRSDDKRVFNLTKGLRIFFARQKAGIFQTCNISLLLWKDRHFYLFDGKGRTEDLYECKDGAAVLANFYDIASVVTILLTRSNFGNGPFVIYPIKVARLQQLKTFKKECGIGCTCNFHVINDYKAVVQGTMDLGHKCFEFSRNKQALAMATISLIYSRITPPSAWQKQTIDKILLIGNQLYNECAKSCLTEELNISNLPAIFTIGPYIVEIYIYPNKLVDVMYKKCCCQFRLSLEKFFETNNNAIAQIETFTIAIWRQRNMFFCFDPYSRDMEGLSSRNGTACVSMHTDIDSLVDLIISNFENKDYVFNLHALKVCKIHRDPVQSKLFPKHLRLNDISNECIENFRIKTSRKHATAKPITVDCSVMAIRKMLDDEIMEQSVMEIGSTVESIAAEHLPPPFKAIPKQNIEDSVTPFDELVADLDSPSLSDTQMKPPIPPEGEEEIEIMDLDSFALTQEELELQEVGEDEYDGGEVELEGGAGDYEIEMGNDESEEPLDWYLIENQYTQVGASFMENIQKSKLSQDINTEITAFFPIKKHVLYPTFIRDKQQMRQGMRRRQKFDQWDDYIAEEPILTKSQELLRETNFVDLPDDSQIVRGTQNLIHFGEDIEFIAPFVCVMACVVSKKFAIYSWSSDLVDYVLNVGTELYKSSNVRYDQVVKLEIPRISLGKTDYKVLVQYVFDTYSKLNIIELAIDKILFVRSNMGVLVTPTYACALIYKNHLYYMYDGFGNNEVGLSEGPSNKGTACLARFKDVHSMAMRIMYNKRKRESDTGVVYTRFVISSVRVKQMLPDFYEIKTEASEKKKIEREMEEQEGEAEAGDVEVEEGEELTEKKPSPKPGYQFKDGLYVIEGTTMLEGRTVPSEILKEDHFVCICACLLLIIVPLRKWNYKKVDETIINGKYVFSHGDDLEKSKQRTIQNLFIDKYFFNLTIKEISIENKKLNANVSVGIDTLIRKKLSYFLIQCPSACYTVYINSTGTFHIFDPYGIRHNDAQFNAGWVRFKDMLQFKHFISNLIRESGGSYQFYNFEVNSFEKVPKKQLLKNRLEEFEEIKEKTRQEQFGEPLFENIEWLDEKVPWTRRSNCTASGVERDDAASKWRYWDIEYSNDLFSLTGTVSQLSEKFSPKSRGKQTLCNLITSLGMMKIYALSQWNSAIIDSIIVNGDNYFMECTKEIQDENYELSMDDLIETCSIFPFEFKVSYSPVVEGIMFLDRGKQYNLYKALRYFFTTAKRKYGIVSASKNDRKKHVAFGKIENGEYFMFDVDSFGAPMFNDREGLPYILRMTKLNRLLHAIALTLRGGDFYIYDIQVSDVQTMQ